MGIWNYVIAMLGSFFAGVVNVLAGNGSTLTLMILTELMGLPGNVANATNRVGIFTQSASGSWAFYTKGKLGLTRSWWYIGITTIGAIGGIYLATIVSDDQFKTAFRWLMLVTLLILLVKPERWIRETDPNKQPNWWLAVPMFLAVGFYGGFIQMGMGIFFLAVMVLGAHFSLTDSNAVKGVVVAIYTFIALLIFQWKGLIDWRVGLFMAIGQTLGGYFTALYAAQSPKANVWAYRILIVAIVFSVVKMYNLQTWVFTLFAGK